MTRYQFYGVAAASLFEQIWPDTKAQQTIVQELAATHHIEQSETTQLLIKAAPLAYRELKALADGQFLPAFLQDEQSAVRQYLPIGRHRLSLLLKASTVEQIWMPQ